jgi:hypothetical protein
MGVIKMATSFSVRHDVTKVLRKKYQTKLDNMSPQELIREFLSYLDYTEESESGREFNPITIGSCRVLMTQPLNMCLEKLRKIK